MAVQHKEERRLKFNEDEKNYDRWRPCYVPPLFEAIIAYAGLQPGQRALEIGLGTGQATRPFLEAGVQVTAVELGEKLAAFSKEKFKNESNFTVLQGDFMELHLEEASADLVYAATAFHWLPEKTSYEKAKRLLKSGGTLALFWNHPQPQRPGEVFYEELQQVYGKHQSRPSKAPKAFTYEDTKPIEEKLKGVGFEDVKVQLFYAVRSFTAEGYCALMDTHSDHRAMEEKARQALKKDISRVIEKHGGILKVYDTMDLYLAKKP